MNSREHRSRIEKIRIDTLRIPPFVGPRRGFPADSDLACDVSRVLRRMHPSVLDSAGRIPTVRP